MKNMYIKEKITTIWYDFKHGIKNIFYFFKVVWDWRPWDFVYTLNFITVGLQKYLDNPASLQEVDESRLPKEKDMERIIHLLKNNDSGDYIEIAEKRLGYDVTSYEFKFKRTEETKTETDDDKKLYELIEQRSKIEQDLDSAIFKLAREIEQEQWNEMFDIIKKNGKGWWD